MIYFNILANKYSKGNNILVKDSGNNESIFIRHQLFQRIFRDERVQEVYFNSVKYIAAHKPIYCQLFQKFKHFIAYRGLGAIML